MGKKGGGAMKPGVNSYHQFQRSGGGGKRLHSLSYSVRKDLCPPGEKGKGGEGMGSAQGPRGERKFALKKKKDVGFTGGEKKDRFKYGVRLRGDP